MAKGHVITLPQDVQQLADVLPRCTKDLPVIILTINGKDNNSSDFAVRHKKVEEALNWLTGAKENGEPNNSLYKNVRIDKQTLANLPERGILSGVTRAECGVSAVENDNVGIDTGPVNFEDDEKVYNLQTEMGSFVQGSYTFFDQKFKDFSRPFKDTLFHFLRTQEGQNQAHIMPHQMLKVECADFRLRHLRSFVG